MIPDFEDESGRLPPGEHTATWQEVVKRFGGSPRRQELLKGLRQALLELKRAGCKTFYLDGSFVTAKVAPGDFDACWDVDGVDFDTLDPSF